MRWKPGRRSRNLEDRRGQSGRRPRTPFRLPIPRGGGGAGGVRLPTGRTPRLSMGSLLVLAVLFLFFRGDLLQVLGGGSGGQVQVPMPGSGAESPGPVGAPPPVRGSAEEERQVDFVSFVLDDLQATWARLLPGYREAKLVLFRDAVRSGCGYAAAQQGPFYCPADQKVYIDLDFFDDLHRRFGAPGDFAQAYVLAHEIGHHVQTLTGVAGEVRRAQQRQPAAANQIQVRMELQADCLAGVWGHSTAQRDLLEPGDVEEGLAAAAAIGDDRIQRMSTGRVHPEGFTHGSSEQRVRALRRGLDSGDPDTCAW